MNYGQRRPGGRNATEELRAIWSGVDFGRGLHSHEEQIFPHLLRTARAASRILEIGSADGRMIRLLREAGVEAEFTAVDITQRVGDAEAFGVIGDTRLLPFGTDTFDLVFSLGVVEHFSETRVAIQEHARVTRPGGHVFLTTPHLSLATVAKGVAFWTRGQWREGSFQAVRGRNLRLGEMRRHIEAAGLSPLVLQGSGVRMRGSSARRLLRRVLPDRMLHPHLFCLAAKPER